MIKQKAVELKLNNVRMREVIMEKTGFNVTKAIEANELSKVTPTEVRTRRAAPIKSLEESNGSAEDATPARRTAPKYKITTSTLSE